MKVIYDILKKKYASSFRNEKHLFMTCGALDTQFYLFDNTIKINELERAYFCAKQGICMVDLIQMRHEEGVSAMFLGVENLLLNFILQIECLIFNIDSPQLGAEDIMNSVISMKAKIKKFIENIDKTFADKTTKDWEDFIHKFMTYPKFNKIRTTIEQLSEK